MISQGNLKPSILAYFTKIKKLWDEYTTLVNIPVCSCGSSQQMAKLIKNQQLMQFLMGLNDIYMNARGNVLMMNPLPSVNQAYSITMQEERQREISNVASIDSNSSAMAAYQYRQMNNSSCGNHSQNFGNAPPPHAFPPPNPIRPPYQNFHPRNAQNSTKRDTVFCNYCKNPGHTIDKCYKLQFKRNQMRDNRNYKGKRMAANAQVSHEDVFDDQSQLHSQNQLPGSQQNITPDEYNQLMSLLSKCKLDVQSPSGSTSDDHSSMLADNSLCFLSAKLDSN